MGKFIGLLIVAAAIWYVQMTVDFSGFKEKALQFMAQEKTVTQVNAHRNKAQQDVYNATHSGEVE